MCVIAGKLVANREVAEDIVQDVFIRLWEKKAEYDKIPDFRTFLYVAVRNLCYNYYCKNPEIQRTENVEKFPERLFPRVVVYFIPEKIKKMIPIHPFTIFVCS